ncbi:MAG: aryl-sulfate sulfotransferase [Candidatus Thermoplasmatota archaeon]
MKKAVRIHYNGLSRFIILGSVLLCSTLSVTSLALPQHILVHHPGGLDPLAGQILFSPVYSSYTYLIGRDGVVNHTWSSSFFPGQAVYWLGDGTILRTIRVGVGPGGGGAGGGIQKVKWDGTVVWDFRYNTDGYLSHHDIEPLPNGNVLMIAWETKTYAEAVAAGRNPNTLISTVFMPDHLIEVRPTGPTSGEIVWEWHAWDHLIQDYDPSKENYGVVADHPELVDINFGVLPDILGVDWLHTNSVDYHEEFDQILLSVHHFNEIWVIDHSTTTAEAAGHSGGNSGKGGDLLYRWGNPLAYRAGALGDQQFFGQHDATWIDPGCPGEGNILVFNNGASRPVTPYSSVDEIIPPVDATGHYLSEPGSAYGPVSPLWRYTGDPLTSFYASYISGAQRLADGNTLICDGSAGRFFEVTMEKELVWEYINPYPLQGTNDVFKICYIPPGSPQHQVPNLDCTGSLAWRWVRPGEMVTGSFQIQNIGGAGSLLNWSINLSSLEWGTWSFTPSVGVGLSPGDGAVTVQVSVVAPQEPFSKFEAFVRVENQDDPSDFDIVPVFLKTPLDIPLTRPVWYFLRCLLSFFPFFHNLL